MSRVPTATIAAYRAAVYEIDAPDRGKVRFRIDRPNAALDDLMAGSGAQSAAVITAANPESVPLCEAENLAALENLRNAITEGRYVHLPSQANDPIGAWPTEHGFLIIGIPRGDAVALARKFRQNAMVWIPSGAAPELVMLR